MSTSWPERMPPSIQTSICDADRVDDGRQRADRRRRAVELAAAVVARRSARRRRWSTARRASSTSMMPLRISLPPQRFLTHSTSAQLSVGSNCSAVQATATTCRSTPLTWPTMLPKVRRLRAQHAQAPARLGRQVEEVGERRLGRRGQAVLEVLVALAEDLQVERQHQRAALRGAGALDQALDEVAVAHHVELEPERRRRCSRRRPRSSRCSSSTA